MDETACVNQLISNAAFTEGELKRIADRAKEFVTETRNYQKNQGKIDTLLHQYDLSTNEGIALMCLAEALLRIPDKATMDKFISDKISTVEWKNHLSTSNSFFINAATWSLLLTGKIYSPTLDNQKNLMSSLKRALARLGITMIRPVILQMMKAIGNQFVLGEDMNEALTRAADLEKIGYQFSYDMLGEAARTAEDANIYYQAYHDAIDAIGKHATADNPIKNPGISIKLSALHPRYEYAKREIILQELTPRLLALALQAKEYNIGLTVDAEETDRLDLSLELFELIYTHPALDGWEGFGLAVQAYQKRAFFVIDWLLDLAKKQNKRMMVRLVKGAYWDAEIKLSQVQGLNYPVFTRKNSTDVSYLACAKKLFSHPQYIYPQFATHNAYSVAAILEMSAANKAFEFQCLHGMGRPLYDQMVAAHHPIRIYAPVGTHKDLLGYLVRRLLENGANSSFINRLSDDTIPLEKIILDPVARIAGLTVKPHPKIPLPKDIYHHWENSQGIDLTNTKDLAHLKQKMENDAKKMWRAGSLINGKLLDHEKNRHAVVSPSDLNRTIGYVSKANDADVEEALQIAVQCSQIMGRNASHRTCCHFRACCRNFSARNA